MLTLIDSTIRTAAQVHVPVCMFHAIVAHFPLASKQFMDPAQAVASRTSRVHRVLTIKNGYGIFAVAYPDVPPEQLGFQLAANAMAAFQIEAWTYLDSPWDRYIAGDGGALSEEATRGALLFYREAGCSRRHSGNSFADQETHDMGVPQLGPGKEEEAPLDIGRARGTHYPGDMFAFRTPPLRNVELTGPWLHKGACATLEGALHHILDPRASLVSYDASQLPPDLQPAVHDEPDTLDLVRVSLDTRAARPIELLETEFSDPMAFAQAATDPAALDPSASIPASVPSGLSVEDQASLEVR